MKIDIVIILLGILIVYVYLKKYYKKENFEVFFRPYYPISSQTIVKYNNYEGKIDNNKLDILHDVLANVKNEANDGNRRYINFNYSNLPIKKDTIDDTKAKPIVDFLLESINSKLPEGHNIMLVKLEELSKVETEHEAKVSFKMIIEYKIMNPKNYHFITKYFAKEKDNNLVLDIEVLSIRHQNNEKLHLNTLNLIGISSYHLPGSNYFENSNQFTYNNSFSNKIISNKNENDSEAVNNLNDTILPEEDVSINDINTEEAESFFDL